MLARVNGAFGRFQLLIGNHGVVIEMSSVRPQREDIDVSCVAQQATFRSEVKNFCLESMVGKSIRDVTQNSRVRREV